MSDKPDTRIRTVAKIKSAGKHVEFWWEEGPDEGVRGSYHASCKWYQLGAVIEKVHGLEDRILNSGYVGLQLMWELGEYNWELIKVVPDDGKCTERRYVRISGVEGDVEACIWVGCRGDFEHDGDHEFTWVEAAPEEGE